MMKFRMPRVVKAAAEKKTVLVSVVTITLNASRDLPLTIESVAAQDFDDFEYVVVDGQSWDSSHQVFERYSDQIDRIVDVEDSGVYSAMNFAITQCRGKYILFMNAGDTFYSAQALSNIFTSLEGDEPDIIHGDHVYVNNSLELHTRSADFSIVRKALLTGALSHKVLSQFPCHQATLTKRTLFERMGGYDTRLEICADHDFFLRAYDQGATTRYVDETVAHYFGGGLSAQRGDRCRLEWIKTYRSKSLYPQKIDQFFGAASLVRYDTQSERSGAKVSGFHSLEGPNADAGLDTTYSWCAGEGFSIVSPRHHETIALHLVGKNELEGQHLTIVAAGRTLCEVDVPIGWFELTVSFPHPIAASSILEVFPARAVVLPHDHRFVSILLMSFHFESIAEFDGDGLTLGHEYLFGREQKVITAPVLRSGWSALEEAQVWSIGAQSNLTLPVAEDATELEIVINGNPYVADELRQVTILINGVTVREDLSLSATPERHSIPLAGSAWRSPGSNFVTFIPRKTASAPADPRDLGICLHSIKVVGLSSTIPQCGTLQDGTDG
jgi:GT2 family glycosyltransferase